MNKIIFSLLVGFLSMYANAQIVNIPDVNFKNALLNHDPVIDTNNDGEIQVIEAEAAILIIVRGSISDPATHIENLTGLEAFVNIEILDVSENNIDLLNTQQNILLTQITASGRS